MSPLLSNYIRVFDYVSCISRLISKRMKHSLIAASIPFRQFHEKYTIVKQPNEYLSLFEEKPESQSVCSRYNNNIHNDTYLCHGFYSYRPLPISIFFLLRFSKYIYRVDFMTIACEVLCIFLHLMCYVPVSFVFQSR